MATLIVDLPSGERHRCDGDADVRFGRYPELELPLVDPRTARPSPEMSRHVGTLRQIDGTWWVEAGESGHHDLEVFGLDESSIPVPARGAVRLPAVGAIVLPPRDFTIRFRVDGMTDLAPTPPLPGERTQLPVELTPRQVDFLVALAEPELRHKPTLVRRHIAEIGELWGVQRGTVEVALREVRRKMVAAGLLDRVDMNKPGINDTMARVAVRCGLITREDYRWAVLHNGDGPRPAKNGARFATGS